MNTSDKNSIIYNVFQTDIWKNKKLRVFFGSFYSFEKANQAANDLEFLTAKGGINNQITNRNTKGYLNFG
jgi:hypothetical protein